MTRIYSIRNRAISYRPHYHPTAIHTLIDWVVSSERTYRKTQERVEEPGVHF